MLIFNVFAKIKKIPQSSIGFRKTPKINNEGADRSQTSQGFNTLSENNRACFYSKMSLAFYL
jgi:hypothetical protein